MSPSLMDKLRMMDAGQGKSGAAPAPAAAPRDGDGPFHYAREACPLSILGDRRYASPQRLSEIFRQAYPKGLAEDDLLFVDTETTGLSGGAGTIAFQAGLGYIESGAFVVEQFFLRDYHEEPAMLAEIASRLSRFSALVTFNGRAFDIPLLKGRFLLHRLDPQRFPELHADLLFPARRLWKLRLKSCKLSHLEEELLGVRREDDLASALVPQTFFQYLKDRDFSPIERILLHNRQDIISMAQLLFFLCAQYAKPEEIVHEEDLLSLARVHQRSGQMAQAVKCYRLSARGEAKAPAYEALAAHEKRLGRADNAIRLYEALVRHGGDPASAYEALAKLAEHQKRNVGQALSYTRQALLCLAEPSLFPNEAVQSRQTALQYRYARLLRKQDNTHPSQQQEVPR